MSGVRAWRSSSRPNCHSPSHQASHASSTTTTANTAHRLLSRNRQERTRRGYPPSGRPPRAATVPLDSAAWDRCALRGPLRAGRDRPPGVADRPLQPAVLLLHAGRGPRLAPERRGAHRRRGRPPGRHRRPACSASGRSASPAASRWSAAGWSTSCAAPRQIDPSVDVSLTTNALGLERTAQALADAGLDRVNVSLDTVRCETFHTITRRDRFDDVVAGLAGGQGRRADAGEDQRGAAARHQRRPGARAAALGARPGLRAAVHRADAAGRPARLEPDRDGDGRGDPGQPRAGVHAHAGVRAAGERPGRAAGRSTAARPRSASSRR